MKKAMALLLALLITFTTAGTTVFADNGTGNNNANTQVSAADADDDNDMDWGWIGLLGLAGLLGLRRKDEGKRSNQ
ncbi:WGxxGxxG family protein [Chryseomicrobium palamuruense]|uniref:WGxxGxxG family protein n=1 Tax=Chryseomicrobium palamuruense TaxID=682973 RepID=A0ABV8UTY0_9BACL